MSMKDNGMTATQPGCSPALRAQEEELEAIYAIIRREGLYFDLAGQAAVKRILYLLDIRKLTRSKPRGLSAVEAPGADDVTSHPVAPNTQEEGT